MIYSKFHSIQPKNGQENGTETRLLAKKCIMEKTHLKFAISIIIYKQCKHHTIDAFSEYKWIHFINMSCVVQANHDVVTVAVSEQLQRML